MYVYIYMCVYVCVCVCVCVCEYRPKYVPMHVRHSSMFHLKNVICMELYLPSPIHFLVTSQPVLQFSKNCRYFSQESVH